jgi:hypothetical protein
LEILLKSKSQLVLAKAEGLTFLFYASSSTDLRVKPLLLSRKLCPNLRGEKN